MDKKQKLENIFENDPLGLLNVKPANSPVRNEEERLVASFQEINEFYEKFNRAPAQSTVQEEFALYARLKGLKDNPLKKEMLLSYDKYNLLRTDETLSIVKEPAKEINSLDDILSDDLLGLLEDDSDGLFDLKHISSDVKSRADTDFVARRKPCKDFENYKNLFKAVQADLKNKKRKLVAFKQENLRQGAYYIHNGILFLVEKIDITKKEHYKPDGTRVREDGRTRCIFENGTESNMLKRSVEKNLYANGQVVSENIDQVNERFIEKFSNISESDIASGVIYILQSKSKKREIQEIDNLYKIGFSESTTQERIKNASQQPTYLMAEVKVIQDYKCFNMDAYVLEQLLHNFFGESCLNISIIDNNGKEHNPREWFIAPLPIIEQAVQLIITGEIIKYRYDRRSEQITEIE
jgi:hypothetical protein